jgi:LPXTG-motif cell wall-anchored protein
MALTSASRSWASYARKALGASAVTAVALVALAIPASAHTGTPEADCVKDTQHTFLKIHLTRYATDKANTIKVMDGTDTLVPTTEFMGHFDLDKTDLDGTVDHNFVVTVRASDDQQYSFKWEKKVPACVKKEQPPTQSSHPAPPPPHPSSSPSSAAPTTTTTVAAVGVSANLASTGASVAVPLAIGALLLVGGVGMLILVRRRRKV